MRSEKEQKSIVVFVGLVQNSKEEILLTKRKEIELPSAHNKWELPGGKANFGESAEEAVTREIMEETGYKIKANTLLPKPYMSIWEYPTFIQHTIVLCFTCQLIDEKNINVGNHHINEVQWVKANSVRKLDLLPGVEHFLSQCSL